MNSLLEVKNLSVGFVSGEELVPAIRDISFSVNRGEVLALVGESGSGKSVTALSILQLLPSPPAQNTTGQILFSRDGINQTDLLQITPRQIQDIRGNQIAMIFQEPMTSLNPVITCGDQLMETIRFHKGLDRKASKLLSLEWLNKVKLPNPTSLFNRYPHQLSGGQKQRVMIAMAMCCQPALLICDEPTTALDVTVQKTILKLIRELQQETNMGVIFITHDLGVVGEIADRAAVMLGGQIVEQNDSRNLFVQPTHAYTRALLACRPVNHPRGERLPVVSDFMEPDTSAMESVKVKPSTIENSVAETLIQVKGLSVWFPSRKTFLGRTLEYTKAVDDVSFDVMSGETLGLVGESGCGKTTLGRALLRLIDPSSGKIIYRGRDLTALEGKELRPLRKDIQIIFQDPYSSLNPRITIGAALEEPLKVHETSLSGRQRKEQVAELLKKVNLQPEHVRRYPHEFSGGQRQRIVIARALTLAPSFLVCDESVSALDISVQAQVLNLLNDLKKEYGFTIIFISHDLSVVRYISDRILVMNKGKIEESGMADDIYLRPQMNYTKNLIAAIPRGIFKATLEPGN